MPLMYLAAFYVVFGVALGRVGRVYRFLADRVSGLEVVRHSMTSIGKYRGLLN